MLKRIELPTDSLVLLLAPSGAGKSTFARRYFQETEIISSDRCRALVSDDEADQAATRPAFEVFDAILRGRLMMGRLSVADATNLDPLPRRRLRDLAREYGRPAVVIILDVPEEIAHLQNRARARIVPPHVLDMHYERFRAAREAIAMEGYDAIYEVRPGTRVEVVRIAPPPSPNPPAAPAA